MEVLSAVAPAMEGHMRPMMYTPDDRGEPPEFPRTCVHQMPKSRGEEHEWQINSPGNELLTIRGAGCMGYIVSVLDSVAAQEPPSAPGAPLRPAAAAEGTDTMAEEEDDDWRSLDEFDGELSAQFEGRDHDTDTPAVHGSGPFLDEPRGVLQPSRREGAFSRPVEVVPDPAQALRPACGRHRRRKSLADSP